MTVATTPVHRRPPSSLGRPRRRSDLEFLAPALEILETPPSPVRMTLILSICILVVAAIGWAYLGRIDIIAVAQGKIQPTGRVKVIEPLTTGRIKAIHVVNGQHVAAGDVLVELDSSEALADQADQAANLASYQAEIARRRIAIAAATTKTFDPLPSIPWDSNVVDFLRTREDDVLAADLGQISAQLASFDAQISEKKAERDQLEKTIETQKSLISTLQERVDMRSQLMRAQAEPKSSVIDATETLKYQITQLAIQQGQLAAAVATIDVIKMDADKSLKAFVSDNAQKLADAERQAVDLEQKLAKASAATDLMTLRAPISGTVQASVVTGIAQVITTGQEIMRIVPDNTNLDLEVYVRNEDIGFVHVGQEAVVKIQAFPFTRYGTIAAHVVRVAGDAIPEADVNQIEGDPARASSDTGFAGAERTQNLVFPVSLTLDQTSIYADGRHSAFSPGMAVTVEIKTGSRRIIDYIFSPLVQLSSGALRER